MEQGTRWDEVLTQKRVSYIHGVVDSGIMSQLITAHCQ